MSANLLGLPRELRDQIYAYILLDQNYIDLETLKSGSFEQPHSPPLLRTNKMIHHEATLLLYTRNTFNLANCDPEVIPLFLDKIGPDNAKLIWHIRIDFPEFRSLYPNDIRLSDKSILILDKIQSCCVNLSTLTTSWSSPGASELYRLHRLEPPKVGTDALKLVDTRFKAISTLKKIIVEMYEFTPPTHDIRKKMESHGWTLSSTKHVKEKNFIGRFRRFGSAQRVRLPVPYYGDDDLDDDDYYYYDYDYPASRQRWYRTACCMLGLFAVMCLLIILMLMTVTI